jgi:hypothetical protein
VKRWLKALSVVSSLSAVAVAVMLLSSASVPGSAAAAATKAAPKAKPAAVEVGVEVVETEEGEAKVSITVVRGEPAVIGCADGQREGFADVKKFPTLAGCLASWAETKNLRDPSTGQACGDDKGPCAQPADACAEGWHICAVDGKIGELSARATAQQCEQAAKAGSFVAGSSHCMTPDGCEYGPADVKKKVFPCLESGWCSEPICCGPACGTGSCPDALYTSLTHIASGTDQGCSRISSQRAGGILCCK